MTEKVIRFLGKKKCDIIRYRNWWQP